MVWLGLTWCVERIYRVLTPWTLSVPWFRKFGVFIKAAKNLRYWKCLTLTPHPFPVSSPKFPKLIMFWIIFWHCVEDGRNWSFSGRHLPASDWIRSNAERYFVSLRILCECGKLRTRKTLNTDTFYTVWSLL